MTLSVSGLSVARSGRTLLHPTSLDLTPGTRVGLVGASGSGKSTLGHALIDELRRQGKRIAHVPQSPDEALDPLRTIDFHWQEAARAQNTAVSPESRQRLFRALKIDSGDTRKRPWGWSRGMQQRFVIAMALIGNPELIVLDEPTSALDPVVAASTMNLLETEIAGTDTAMLLITHDLGLAAQRVERMLVMHDGQVIESAATRDLLNHPRTPQARALSAHRSWLAIPC